jgi:hypothetical protein
MFIDKFILLPPSVQTGGICSPLPAGFPPHFGSIAAFFIGLDLRVQFLICCLSTFYRVIMMRKIGVLTSGFYSKETKYLVPRLAYKAFVKEIEFEKDGLLVMHTDYNDFNNYYKNLIVGHRSEVVQRSYDRKRHISPFALKTKKEILEIQ